MPSLIGGGIMLGLISDPWGRKSVLAAIFGRCSVGSLFGMIRLSHPAGRSLGAWPGGFRFDVIGGDGVAFGVAAVVAILSRSINEHARPACRAVPIPSRPHPVAGGT